MEILSDFTLSNSMNNICSVFCDAYTKYTTLLLLTTSLLSTYTGMSEAWGQGERTPHQVLDPPLLLAPQIFNLPTSLLSCPSTSMTYESGRRMGITFDVVRSLNFHLKRLYNHEYLKVFEIIWIFFNLSS